MPKSKKWAGFLEGGNHNYATGGAYGAGHGPGRGRPDNLPLYIMLILGRYSDTPDTALQRARNRMEWALKRGVRRVGRRREREHRECG